MSTPRGRRAPSGVAAQACLVGIDVGTSAVKVVGYDLQGKALCVRSFPNRIVYGERGFSHFDAEGIRDSVLRGLRQVSEAVKGTEVLAIGVSSVGESGVLVDRSGKILYPAITWFDSRTKEHRQYLSRIISDRRLHSITGMNPDHIYSLLKILWIRDSFPRQFAKAVRWLCLEDYVISCLSGIAATDYSIACRTLAFDRHKKQWNIGLLHSLGIDPALFSTAVPSGTPIGELKKEVQRQCRLPAKTIVATGGHDHVCAAFALGITRPGVVMDSTGTSEAVATFVEEVPNPRSTLATHYDCYPHVVESGYMLSGSLPTSGGALEWARRISGENATAFYQRLSSRAQSAPVGSNGLVFLPFLEGSGTPHAEREVRGLIGGLSLSTSTNDLIRSLLEGISYWLVDNVHVMETLIGKTVEEIVVTGGGAKNLFWLQMKADVTGKRLVLGNLTETVALGTAFLAGRAAGFFPDTRAARRDIAIHNRVIHPDRRTHELYQELFERFYLPQKLVHLRKGQANNHG